MKGSGKGRGKGVGSGTSDVAFFFHLVSVLSYVYGYLWHFSAAASQLPGAKNWGWFYRYLTFWSYTTQLIALFFCMLVHILPEWKLARRISDDLCCAVFGIANVVCILYWCLYYATPEPVEGANVERPLPLTLHVHVYNGVMAWVDLFLSERTFRKRALHLSITIALSYVCFILLCRFHDGGYPYPFLNKMPHPEGFIGVAIVAVTAALGFFRLGKYVRNRYTKGGKLKHIKPL